MTEITEQNTSSSKMMRVIEKEFTVINSSLREKVEKSEMKHL
jgi:hypothetical protein